MADAKKCDLCKKCFDPLECGDAPIVRFRNPVFRTSANIRNNAVGYYLIENQPDTMIDLCPRCTDRFILFMNGYPLANET